VGRSYEEEIEAWHADRMRRLRAPDGWLSLVALGWLREGRNSIGSDPGGDVVLPSGPPRAGMFELTGGRVTLRANPEAELRHKGKLVTRLEMRDDSGEKPTVVAMGSVRFHVINREGKLGVRVRDVNSPLRRALPELERYPTDPRWRLKARLHRSDREVRVPNVLEGESRYSSPGSVEFELDNHKVRLTALLDPGPQLLLVFGDRTNGIETYGGGRFLTTAQPDHHGRVIVDFNRAYNPPCAFTHFATCPLPPPENQQPLAVRAGELAPPG
jgi:uncharacterized protein